MTGKDDCLTNGDVSWPSGPIGQAVLPVWAGKQGKWAQRLIDDKFTGSHISFSLHVLPVELNVFDGRM